MQYNHVQWNGKESYAHNGLECHLLPKMATRSFQIVAPGLPKSVPEAPRDSKIRVGEHFEQQVGLPWPIWAAIGTHEGSILTFLGLILDLPGFIVVLGGDVGATVGASI